MTHEPECLEVGYELDPSEFCSICITARSAYQRGREDAAMAVAEALSHKRNPLVVLPSDPPQFACMCGRQWGHESTDPVVAARGDGEQA